MLTQQLKGLSIYLLLLTAVLISCLPEKRTRPLSDYNIWEVYGGKGFMHYSTLDQINRNNVDQLGVAWTFHTGDSFDGSEIEANPIVIDSVLYTTTPRLRVIALHGATGELLWSFDPFEGHAPNRKLRNRGVSFQKTGMQQRLFFTAGHYLYALSASDGSPIDEFGDGGRVDLRYGLDRDPELLNIRSTSPGVVYQNLIILGSAVSERLPSAPGHIRAYNCMTGNLEWTFHTIPHPEEPGYETWPQDAWKYAGGANNWAGMTLDGKRGLVFIPTGSAAFDFYGANRPGDNLYANCLLALEAESGELVWYFQGVRHDVWDRDFPSPPTLVTVRRRGKLIDAIAQITKSGHVYVFNRATGEPLFPIEEIDVPESDVPGEQLADKQPLPVKPAPFARQEFTPELVTERTQAAHDSVLARLRKVRSGKQFMPPSTQGTVIFPGFDGGGEWGGAAFDPETGILYVNSNEMAWILRLVERIDTGPQATGRELYLNQCASCHRENLKGTPPEFPSLIDIEKTYSRSKMDSLLVAGSGRMPAFSFLSDEEREALIKYLLLRENLLVETSTDMESPFDLQYSHDGYNKFLDPEGYPAVKPPWGTLNALDLDSGEYLWQIPFGEYPELAEKGLENTGSENYGGPVVTAGGLVFIGATIYDKKFRAFDKKSGKLLWETTLPAAGTATPSTYMIDGKQYVVIAAGGGKWGEPSGDTYVAFALSDE